MISIIVVDYNSMDETISYIKNFTEKIKVEDEVNFIIVDNSINEDNFKKLNDEYMYVEKLDKKILNEDNLQENVEKMIHYEMDKIKIIAIKSKSNLGFAKANNLGAIVSRELFKDQYLIFSNNDLCFEKPFLMNSILEPFKSNPFIAVVGPKIIGIDGMPQSPMKKIGIWKKLILTNLNTRKLNLFGKIINNIDYTNNSKYVYWVIGCFMIADSKKFFEVGMFDNNTFLYGEEMILAERLLRKNYKMYFYNNIEIVHKHGQTIKKTFDSLKACKINFNSNYYYYKTYIKSNKLELLIAGATFRIYEIAMIIRHNLIK